MELNLMCFIPPGKSLFIIYALVARLGRRRVVALQLRKCYALFEESGVSFYSLDDANPLTKFHCVWALVDSNDKVLNPSEIFRGRPNRVRPIQTTSPREKRWKEWTKYTGAKCYVMDIWSEKEIADLA